MESIKNKKWDILLVGRYFCDLIFSDLPEFPRLGHEVYARSFNLIPGGVYTPAVALTRLGVRVAWPCVFGSDVFSQWVKSEALNEGVDGTYLSDSPHPSLRITTAFSFGEERAFLSYVDPIPEPPYVEILHKIQPRWLFLTHLIAGEALEELVTAARSVKAKVYMDCQAHDRSLDEPEIRDALESVDVFSPNAAEAKQLAGCENMEETSEKLAAFVPIVIIKNGKSGCLCRQGERTLYEKAIDVDIVDTTGAGDNFNSGFLYGQLNDYSMKESLRIGNLCGGMSVQGHGGTATSADKKDINAWQKRADNK